MPRIDGEVVTDDESNVPVGGEQESSEVVSTQVDTEDKQLSDQEINWKRANETMRNQSSQITSLNARLEQLTKPPEPEIDRGSILTYGEASDAFDPKINQLLSKISELEARVERPDMSQVIDKYGKTLPESVKKAVLKSENPYLTAYEACLDSKAYYKDTLASTTKHKDAKRVESNLGKAGSASSVGTPGALNQAKLYDNMSFDEILAKSNKIINGE